MTEDNILTKDIETQQALQRAYNHRDQSEFHLALAECRVVIKFAPHLAEAHNLHGIILEELKDVKQAMLAYQEALRLDPHFDEARQNLDELQTELLQQNLDKDQKWHVMKWSALGYGLGMAMSGILVGLLFKGQSWNYYLEEFITAVLLIPAGCLGGLLLGKGIKSRRMVALGVMSGVGFGLGYFFTIPMRFITLLLFRFSSNMNVMMTAVALIHTIRFAIIGGVTGCLLGAVQEKWQLVARLGLAGAVGLGFYGPFRYFVSMSLFIWVSDFIPASMIGSSLYSGFVYAFLLVIEWGLMGSVVGLLYGLAMKYKSVSDLEIIEFKTQP